jgi:hypothetical protein
VSTAAANMLLTSDLIDSAKSATPDKAVAETRSLKNSRFFFAIIIKRSSASHTVLRAARATRRTCCRLFSCGSLRTGARDFLPNAGGYLHRAAVNASLDLIRSRTRANSVSLDVIDFDQSSKLSVASPEDDFADVELRELIRHAVAKLEGRAATAFALRYFEGYDNARIAQSFRHVANGRRGHAAPRQNTLAQRDRQLFGETS